MTERRDESVLLGRDMYKFVSAVGGTATVLYKYPGNAEYAAIIWMPLFIAAVVSWVMTRGRKEVI